MPNSAFLLKNPNFQGHWKASRWPWTFQKRILGGVLVPVVSVSAPRLVLSER